MILMIDNYDSFTYNLVQMLSAMGVEVAVRRNDALGIDDIRDLRPRAIVISPGPGRPEDAGVSVETVRRFAGVVPVLGVCLGHQCIAQAFGARIVQAAKVMHGKLSLITHDGTGLFEDIPGTFTAVRYHSLAVEDGTLPGYLRVCARTFDDGEIMGLVNDEMRLYGVQFHPESIATEHGGRMMERFVAISRRDS